MSPHFSHDACGEAVEHVTCPEIHKNLKFVKRRHLCC